MAKKKTKKSVKKKPAKKDKDSIIQLIILIIGLVAIIALIVVSGKQAPEDETKIEGPMPTITQRTEYTFDNTFEDIEKLNKEYVTEWKKERLGKYMVNLNLIDPYIEELQTLKQWMAAAETDEKALLFVKARMVMLQSQKEFQNAVAFGAQGAVNEGSTCEDVDTLKQATKNYNASLQLGHEFNKKIDKILRLAVTDEQKEIRDMIGINTKKPRFYLSPFGDIYKLTASNTIFIENCEQ